MDQLAVLNVRLVAFQVVPSLLSRRSGQLDQFAAANSSALPIEVVHENVRTKIPTTLSR
jgi:hypothetical protein